MIAFIIQRVFQGAAVVLAMSLIVFVGVYAIGDPVEILINPDADQQTREAVRQSLGLDKPLWMQYLYFVKSALHGDLGTSFVFNIPAIQLILQRLPATLELALTATVLAILLGIPLGLVSGLNDKRWYSRMIMAGSILGFSLPTFWVGLILILVFGVWLGWLPVYGRGDTVRFLGVEWSIFTLDGLRHIILPAFNLALFKIALFIRLTRAGVMEVVNQDYIRFANAMGIRKARLLWRHILKNIMIPIVTVIGIEFGSVVAFAVVTESIFNWPGMGKLIIESINHLDRPVIVAYLMVIVVMFVIINLLVDLLYAGLDPRVRLGSSNR
ncbi:ABC transporter permease [Hoeflea sp. WL0058]|uniref:ABC transporter permease n=1 Tax=Flavimaribacter sediminis TaxID=2865987 RepID=A0AAE3CYK5_9HYPH|nr:ABC transporter permease [Flavimaribacter sediminis]MBW8636365.1 ABC transporter permease [Flavimaribacter sediminis]